MPGWIASSRLGPDRCGVRKVRRYLACEGTKLVSYDVGSTASVHNHSSTVRFVVCYIGQVGTVGWETGRWETSLVMGTLGIRAPEGTSSSRLPCRGTGGDAEG